MKFLSFVFLFGSLSIAAPSADDCAGLHSGDVDKVIQCGSPEGRRVCFLKDRDTEKWSYFASLPNEELKPVAKIKFKKTQGMTFYGTDFDNDLDGLEFHYSIHNMQIFNDKGELVGGDVFMCDGAALP